MAQINHNISSPNDDLGDQLRTAFGNQNTMNTDLYSNKVDKVTGKGLTENEFTNALKDKLDNIDLDAQINVQADWEQEDDTQDDYIKNKPAEYFNSVGSFHYADLATQTTPLNGVANVEKNLTNDIDGAETDLTNAPYGISTLWDSAANKLDFLQLAIGDIVNLRTTLKVTTSTANQNINVYARIGLGSTSEKDLLIGSKFVETAGEITFDEELTIVILKEDYINYIGELFLLSENNSTIKVQEFEFVVIRKNINVIDIDGLTDLSATRTPTNVQINSSTGTPALIGLADATNAGLLKPAKYTVLENTSGTNTGDQDLSGKANIASPTFTGTPLAPTATVGTNTTQVATTAFVLENSSSVSLSTANTWSGVQTFLTGMFGLRNVANTFTSFFLNTNTAARTYTLQDRSYTVADDADIAVKVFNSTSLFSSSINGGLGAGSVAQAIMFGNGAGYLATGAAQSNFLGADSGNSSTSATRSNFFGFSAGASAPNANNCNFLGYSAGQFANANNCNFFGSSAGYNSSGSNVNAFGNSAGYGNAMSGQTIFSNTSMPSYADRSAATTAITVVNGAITGNTYLYYNATTFGIEAVRL